MPSQIKMQPAENKTKLWFVAAQGLVLMTDTVLMLVSSWRVSFGKCQAFCFVLQIKCRDSNAQKNLGERSWELLQFVLRSPSEGAETMLTLVDKECSGNDRSKG